MKTIDLRIERIVIDGVTLTPVERARLRTALEAQLSDRLSRDARHGLDALRARHGEAALRAPLLMPADATPGQWGRGIADAVTGAFASRDRDAHGRTERGGPTASDSRRDTRAPSPDALTAHASAPQASSAPFATSHAIGDTTRSGAASARSSSSLPAADGGAR